MPLPFSFLQGGVSPFRTLLNTLQPFTPRPIQTLIGWIEPADAVTDAHIFDATNNTLPTGFADVRATSAFYFGASSILQSAASNVARIETDPKTTSILGLMAEDTATNLLLQTTALASGYGTFNLTNTTDGTMDPTGTVLARKLTASAGASQFPELFSNTTPVVTSGSNYPYSFYVKFSNWNYVYISNGSSSSNNWATAIFDISGTSDTTATQTAVGATSGTIVSTKGKYLGGGWWRLTLVSSQVASSVEPLIGFAGAATGNSFGTDGAVGPMVMAGTEVFYIAKPDYCLGSFETSHIDTTTTSVTRAADAVSFTPDSTDILLTYEDGSTVPVSGLSIGGTYTLPTSQLHLLYIDDVVAGAFTGTAAGSSTVLGVGAALFSGVGSAAGSGAATATGNALFSGVGSAAGAGTATATGTALAKGAGSAAGAGTASGVGQSIAASVGSATGAGTASGVGASTAASVGSAAGSGAATATGKALFSGAGSAAGSGAATAVGNALFSGVGSAAGSGAATGIGASMAASVGAAAGLGAATGIGKSTAASVGTAAGSGAATGIGASIAKAVGASAGVGTATALAAGASIATAAGVGTATGVGRAIVNAVGTAVGGATVTATGKALFSGIGTAAGSGTATGVGSTAGTVVSAVGTAAGSALAQAVSSSIVVGSSDFTGSPWRIGTDKVPAQFASPPWMVTPRDLPIEPPAGDYVGEFSAADFSAHFSTTLTFTVGDTPIGGKVPHSLAWRLARNSNNSALTFQNWTVE